MFTQSHLEINKEINEIKGWTLIWYLLKPNNTFGVKESPVRCASYKVNKLMTVCFVGIRISSFPDTFVNVNPDHIGFFRVNYDNQSWAILSSLLLQNHTVSDVMSNLSGGSLIRGL